MKLKEWTKYSGITPTTPTTETGAVSVCIEDNNDFRKQLWDLEDYKVSSVSGIVVWLIPQQTNEHLRYLAKNIRRDQWIYTVRDNNTKSGNGKARYFIAIPDREVIDITSYLSNGLGFKWRNGWLYVSGGDVSQPIDHLAQKLFGDYRALKHGRL